MKTEPIPCLHRPVDGQLLHAADAHRSALGPSVRERERRRLFSDDGEHRHPAGDGMPRMVPARNHAAPLHMQDDEVGRPQMDSHSDHPISADRLRAATGWYPADPTDSWILNVGRGADGGCRP